MLQARHSYPRTCGVHGVIDKTYPEHFLATMNHDDAEAAINKALHLTKLDSRLIHRQQQVSEHAPTNNPVDTLLQAPTRQSAQISSLVIRTAPGSKNNRLYADSRTTTK